jgi:two-component system NarL family sensor kinase
MHTGKSMAGRFDPAFYESALDAFTANVAVVDAQGEIVAVNDAWVQFINLNDLKPTNYGIGCNYLGYLRSAGHPRRRCGGRRLAGADRGGRWPLST